MNIARFTFILLVMTAAASACAQQTIQWQKALGGTLDDYCWAVRQTSDKGYIITGNSWSNNGDVSGNHGDFDFWVVKTDSSGLLQWQKSFGGSNEESSFSVDETFDKDNTCS